MSKQTSDVILAKPAIWPWSAEGADAQSLDECVQQVTAFSSWDDLAATSPTYAPSFYIRHDTTPHERRCMERVRDAFNHEMALKRARRAEIHENLGRKYQ